MYSAAPLSLQARELLISFTGDIMMHSAVKASAARNDRTGPDGASLNNAGFDYLFEPIAPLLKKSHIVAGNLEIPIAGTFESREIIFNCRPEVLPALKKAGFTMLSLANNHILDQGIPGARETHDRVVQNGLDAAGAGPNEESARAGVIRKSGNLTVGFLACTGITNYPIIRNRLIHINWFYNEASMTRDIKAMKERADYVILMVHTGREYNAVPEAEDAALMRRYCDAGVDCIIGHHPHVLQPLERYRAPDGRICHIFYSLGNFISNQSIPVKEKNEVLITTEESLIVTLKIAKNPVTKKIKTRFTLIPIVTRKEYSAARGSPDIQVVPLKTLIAETKKKGAVQNPEGPAAEDTLSSFQKKVRAAKNITMAGSHYDTIIFID
jgi:poly-gamma-glutamate synthesis protein (capsule biosynthesis protein)